VVGAVVGADGAALTAQAACPTSAAGSPRTSATSTSDRIIVAVVNCENAADGSRSNVDLG